MSVNPDHFVGPTWQTGPDGSFVLPKKTIAWQAMAWAGKKLMTPGDPNKPFRPTKEQARFFAWWFAVDDEGRFVYRQGTLRRMKGWGKDPVAAVLSLIELCGPSEFSHWDERGNPVGREKLNAWIQLAAVSKEQTKNTFTLFPSMVPKATIKEYKIEINKTVIYASQGRMIEAVTSSPTTLEGGRPTLVIKNETQYWRDANGGTEMAGVIEGNVLKGAYGRCRSLAICNGHRPGENSDAEADYDKYRQQEAGEASFPGFLYDALEAPADTPVNQIPSPLEDPEGHAIGMKKLLEGLAIARGDAEWLDIHLIRDSFFDTKNPVSESRRKFLNQINATEESWIAPHEWDVCKQQVALEPGDKITMGLDGSKSDDHTGLVACRISDGALFVLNHWNPRNTGGEIPRHEVDRAVREAFALYKVVSFRSDVKEFEIYVDQWSKDFRNKLLVKASPGNPVAFDMRGQTRAFASDCDSFVDAVLEGVLIHDGNPLLRNHVTNAQRNPTHWGTISIMKPSRGSSRKIDLAVCAVLAWGARQVVLMDKSNVNRGAAVYR